MARIRTIKPDLLDANSLEAFKLQFAGEEFGPNCWSVDLPSNWNEGECALEDVDLERLGGVESPVFQASHYGIDSIFAGQLPRHGIGSGPQGEATTEDRLELLKDRPIALIHAYANPWRVASGTSPFAGEWRQVNTALTPEESTELCHPNLISNHTHIIPRGWTDGSN